MAAASAGRSVALMQSQRERRPRLMLNTLVHARDTPDTLRCAGRLDLTAEPIVLTVPDTCGRYYALWVRDERDVVFASIGARTTGTHRAAFALLGPDWHGHHLPAALTPIASPTATPRISGCIEAADERDEEALRRAYDGFRLMPLSHWQRGGTPDPRPPSTTLEQREDAFDLPADVLHAVLDTDQEGRPLSGAHRYRLRFEPDHTPPVRGFWSLSTRVDAVGDLHGLAIDPDASLRVQIQHLPPPRGRRSNWLPVPAEAFSLALDLYWPQPEAVRHHWAPPPIERL